MAPDREERCITSNIPVEKRDPDPIALMFGNAILKSLTSSDPALETAGSIWHAGHALALYLIEHPSIVQGKHVLELGSGCGLVGLTCAVLGAKTVILTDLATQQMHLQRNIELTRDLWSQQCDTVAAATLPFGEFSHYLFSADVLLGADIGYDPSLHEPISRTVSAFLTGAECNDRNEQNNEGEGEPNDVNGKNGRSRSENNDIIGKTCSRATKNNTKCTLLAEEIRWKDVYEWYQEVLRDMDIMSLSETVEYEQTRTVLKTRANLDDDKDSSVVQVPRKCTIELTTTVRTTIIADITDKVAS